MRRFLPLLLLLGSCGGPEPPAPEPVPVAKPGAESGEAQAAEGAQAPAPGLPPRPEGPPFAGFTLLRDALLDAELPWKHAGTLKDPVPVNLDFLGAWEFDETKDQVFPPEVMALDGRKVVIRGFMLPSVDFQEIREFHLVRSLWGCCFGAPPRLNEIVRVNLPKGVDYTYDGLEIVGTLRAVYETEDGIAEDLYRLQADGFRELDRYEDPEAPEDFNPAKARGIILGTEEEF
ncbi:MAG: DUF3299 domain-containing protein [Planctomycetes bacterium]|nr:DUF3299 domain-containing protein [Planctomycetota bacterium]MBL7008144.1 DUF3299 domain-containing protein [Planctomycetota bacterium]